MTVREILRLLLQDGWEAIPTRKAGSHLQLRHPVKKGKVTVPVHAGDLRPGTLNSIMKQAGLK